MLLTRVFKKNEEDRWITTEIYVPQFLNDGSPTPDWVFDEIDERITEVFGGYSMREDYGVWVDPETGSREDMLHYVYIITYNEEEDPDATVYLNELVYYIGTLLGQQIMYTTSKELAKSPFITIV